jgi:Glycosyl transferase family 2
MQTALIVVLWSSLALAIYACVVYPLVVWFASRFVRDAGTVPELDGSRTLSWPRVTLLIAARREENLIVDRLRNASALNYPPDRLEILVGCDGEGDLTSLLARSFEDSRVRVVSLPGGRGFASELEERVPKTTGEILVFSDARTMMRPDALRRLVRHFQRPEVGAVCGKLLPIDPTTGRNLTGLVWRFETSVSRCEARLGGLAQINAGIFAIRKSLCGSLEQDGSFAPRVARNSRPSHYRLIYDNTAIAVEETPPTAEAAFRSGRNGNVEGRRILRQLGSRLLGRSALMAGGFWLHRQLRRISPALLLAALVSNACLSQDSFYLHVLLLHESFYLLAICGLFLAGGNRWRRALRVPVGLMAKGLGLAHSAWQSLPGRRRRVTMSASPRNRQPAAQIVPNQASR